MRTFSILFTLLISNLLIACAENGHVAPDAPPGPTTIRIAVDPAPALVAFRDGLDAPWQPATMTTPTSFEAEVEGPYLVTVVCEDPATGRSRMLQLARTRDDAHDLTLSCFMTPSEPPIEHTITGHMVQAGSVQLGSSSDTSKVPDWDFQLAVANGAYDLVAMTAERIAVRRGVAVDGDLAMTPAIDIAAEGTALVDVAFTVDNAAEDEVVAVSVDLLTSPALLPAQIYLGPPATAMVAPSGLLMTESQRVTMRATHGGSLRALQRPFLVGEDTELTLPLAFDGVQWSIEDGQLSTSWTTLPQLDSLDISARSASADATSSARHDLRVTPLFLAETGITHIAIDTDIPGYKPAWRVDFTGAYTRDMIGKHAAGGALATSSVTEEVNALPPGERSTPRTAPASGLR